MTPGFTPLSGLRPRSASRRPLTLFAVAALLAGCAGTAPGPASMLETQGYGQVALSPVARAARMVDLIEVTALTIDQVAGAPAAAAGYRLGVGDVMQIFVVDEPELTLEAGYRVGADGTVLVPYLGRVPVAERSADEIRHDLETRLAQYRQSPQVDVRVTEFNARQISVVGEVRQPNRQALTDRPLTVIDAINAAGGFTGDPARTPVTLIRAGVERGVDVRGFLSTGQALPEMQEGDVLRVGGRRAATRDTTGPQVLLHRGGDRADRIALDAGALTLARVVPTPTPGAGVFVLRLSDDRIRSYGLTAQAARDPALGGRFTLRPGDVVTIQPAPASDPERLVAQLSPALRLLDRN
ncbi:MAG: polysaccharide biosynthesis/export family protein [Pararhodobacter sp.]|nr:polysaccharide biosynthesis/export family protein [Pararhodobacter sp.]